MDGEPHPRPNMREIFKGQSERAFIFGKLERLAHAVVLILSQTGSAHPVVDRLETTVLDSVREAAAGASELEQSFLISILLEIVSLVRIASTARIISERNSAVLTDEYMALLQKLAQPSVQGMLLRTEDLLSEVEGESADVASLPSPIGSLFSNATNKMLPRPDKRHDDSQVQKNYKGQKTAQLLSPSNYKASQASKHTDRSQRIVDIVTVKGVVSIRDVAGVITDCSEKTLQRELLSLVENGILKKEGERRWSTYRLV